jgi:hypothetical protein
VTGETRHLQLAIDVDSDPISGSVSNGAHRSQPFNGWIELVAAIEAVRSSGHASTGSAGTLGSRDKRLGSFPGASAQRL